MQMLVAGGIPALTDGVRASDTDNPRGYFEFERVKQLRSDKAWLDDAHGKVVKIIFLLLMELPTDRAYRIVFMRRSGKEVARSQATMLQRSGRAPTLPTERLIAIYEQQLSQVDAWLAARPNFAVLNVTFADLVGSPATIVGDVNRFLGGSLDEAAMMSAVDPTLYRNR